MPTINIAQQTFNINDQELKKLYDCVTSNTQIPTKLEDIGDAIAALDNLNYLILKKDLSFEILKNTKSLSDIFDIFFDITYAKYEMQKFDLSQKNDERAVFKLHDIFRSIKESKQLKSFLELFIKKSKIHGYNPAYFLLLYEFKDQFAEYYKGKLSISKKVKAKNNLSYTFLKLGYKLERILDVVTLETGTYFLRIATRILKNDVKTDQALVNAVSNSNIELIDRLIKSDIDVNIKNKNGDSMLHITSQKGEAIIADLLIKNNIEINALNSIGETALFEAARRDDIMIIALLFKNKIDPNILNKNGQSSLMIAANRSRPSVVKFLLDHGANYKEINFLFGQGLKSQRIKYIESLITHANLSEDDYLKILNENKKGSQEYRNEYKTAQTNIQEIQNHTGILTPDMTEKQDDSVNFKDAELIDAVLNLNEEKTIALLKEGVNPIIKNKEGLCHTNLIHLAAWFNSIPILQALLDNGADINKQNTNGNTPIYFAVLNENEEVFNFLIHQNANHKIKNNCGISPLDVIKQKKLDKFSEIIPEEND